MMHPLLALGVLANDKGREGWKSTDASMFRRLTAIKRTLDGSWCRRSRQYITLLCLLVLILRGGQRYVHGATQAEGFVA
ncbi:uncharacterized protein BDV14DRAFT_178504 [Aspergillus stella-maris]|uniref:uncharacterized protein n=1 Tax=Aspergillus stella-maris TaxID=1810926 RepID=UPI003CCCC4D8